MYILETLPALRPKWKETIMTGALLEEPGAVSGRKSAAATFGASSSEQLDAALHRFVFTVILDCGGQKPGDESQEKDQGRPLLHGWGFPNRSNHASFSSESSRSAIPAILKNGSILVSDYLVAIE